MNSHERNFRHVEIKRKENGKGDEWLSLISLHRLVKSRLSIGTFDAKWVFCAWRGFAVTRHTLIWVLSQARPGWSTVGITEHLVALAHMDVQRQIVTKVFYMPLPASTSGSEAQKQRMDDAYDA